MLRRPATAIQLSVDDIAEEWRGSRAVVNSSSMLDESPRDRMLPVEFSSPPWSGTPSSVARAQQQQPPRVSSLAGGGMSSLAAGGGTPTAYEAHAIAVASGELAAARPRGVMDADDPRARLTAQLRIGLAGQHVHDQ